MVKLVRLNKLFFYFLRLNYKTITRNKTSLIYKYNCKKTKFGSILKVTK